MEILTELRKITSRRYCCQNCLNWQRAKTIFILLMPLVSLVLMILIFAHVCSTTNQFEIFICLSYASIHLAVNFMVVIGCETHNRTYLIPWLVWMMFSVALSITFATVLIFNAINIDVKSVDQNILGSSGLITISILLLVKSGLYCYFWLGVLDLYRLLKHQVEDIEARAKAPQEQGETLLDKPPGYLKVINCNVFITQERKKRGNDLPPTYLDVIRKSSKKFDQAKYCENLEVIQKSSKKFDQAKFCENLQPLRPPRKK